MIAVKDSLNSSVIAISSPLEIVCVRVTISDRHFIFCACYRPPNSSPTFCADLHDVLNKLIIRFHNSPLFVLGDFNFADIIWQSDCVNFKRTSAETIEFLNLCFDFNLTQLVHKPTRVTPACSNTLDLVLSTTPDLVSPLTYLPGISDHSLLQFDLKARFSYTKKTKTIRDYSKADLAAITEQMEHFMDEMMPDFDERTLEQNWSLFKCKLLFLIENYVPQRKVQCNPQSPWFTAALRRLCNKKKRLYRSAKKSNNSNRWSDYHRISEEYCRAISQAKQTFFNVTLPSYLQVDPRKFWNVVRGNAPDTIQLSQFNTPVQSDQCCTVFNDVFASFFHDAAPVHFPPTTTVHAIQMDPILIDWVGIRKLIGNLKTSSSAGSDEINSKILKCTELYSSIILSRIFQQSLHCSSLPSDWKVGKVVPVHKSGNTHSPENYRPISLTSIPCKILEHIIYSHLIDFLETNSFFNNSQHGFRKSFSCETQLACFTNDLFSNTDLGFDTDCIFIDFAKAFDTVSHNLLIHKLSSLNIDPLVLGWIKNFLANRTQYVIANSSSSAPLAVTSGVPQGSVLGPLLFLVYINDLASCVKFSTIRLFADDCVLYRKITDLSDSKKLQHDMNNVLLWCNKWSMKLNLTKCKCMHVSQRTNVTNPNAYLLNNSPLSVVSSYKYLGLNITSNLSWHMHVDNICSNANRMLGYLRRNFSSAPSSLKLTLYKTLVRSKLEYACAIWDPSNITLVNSIEAIQNRATRFILSNYSRYASVTSMKSTLKLPELSFRRRCFRLSLFHKIYHHNPLLKEQLITQPSYISSRSDHCFKVGVPSSRTKLCSHSFIPSTSKEWNHLPATVAAILDTDTFKTIIHETPC